MKLFSRFFFAKSGATAIEYGLLAALISVGLLAGLGTYSNAMSNLLNVVSNVITTTF